MYKINILDRSFEPIINEDFIQNAIKKIAVQINESAQNPLFIAVLNGSFIFASDLLKEITIPCQIEFIKVKSYAGTQSSGKVQELIGLSQSIEGRQVILLEDIIDTGLTLDYLLKELRKQNPESIKIGSLMLKPTALKVDIKPDYVGFEVENHFLVGYGLDYNGYGRNLKNIYKEV